MARFQSETETYELWIEGGDTVMTRRYETGAPLPEPQVAAHPARQSYPGHPDYPYDPEFAADHARRVYCDRQRKLLADGWQRVHDPEREAAYLDDPRDPELERALRDDPDDTASLLVYADHLQQLGHPRGQLIALELAVAPPAVAVRAETETEARSRRLRQTAKATLLGSLANRSGLTVHWHRGFIDRAVLQERFDIGVAEDLLYDLLRHPSARLLRDLTLDCRSNDTDQRLLLDVLLLATSPPPLRCLAMPHRSRMWKAFPELGDFARLGTVYPLLEDVRIEGDNTCSLTGLALPRARRFAFETLNIRRAAIHAIYDAPWPVLEELELWFGHQSPCTIEDLELLFDGTLELPRLRKLRLRAALFGTEIIQALTRSPLARQLELLDLRHGVVRDRAVDALIAAREDLRALRCNLEDTGVSADALQRLAAANLRAEP